MKPAKKNSNVFKHFPTGFSPRQNPSGAWWSQIFPKIDKYLQKLRHFFAEMTSGEESDIRLRTQFDF